MRKPQQFADPDTVRQLRFLRTLAQPVQLVMPLSTFLLQTRPPKPSRICQAKPFLTAKFQSNSLASLRLQQRSRPRLPAVVRAQAELMGLVVALLVVVVAAGVDVVGGLAVAVDL